jgi:FkbM family methyltransferase
MSLTQTLNFIVNHPLNRNHKASAIKRYVQWQIGSRLVPGPVVLEWVGGAKVIVRPGEKGMTQNVYCGLQEFADMAYLLHMVTPNDLFVDVGANVGSYTVLACAARGARGYCFEPVPATFARLMENLAINNLASRVTALNVGLAEIDGELRFTTGMGPSNHVVSDGDGQADALRVPVRRLEQALAGESPAFLKIDVEGFETPVLKGAEAILANPSVHSILIELNGSGLRYGFSEDAIVSMLNGFGFSACTYDPFGRELRPMMGKNNTGDNTLFVRNPDVIQERLKRAPRVRVGPTEF